MKKELIAGVVGDEDVWTAIQNVVSHADAHTLLT